VLTVAITFQATKAWPVPRCISGKVEIICEYVVVRRCAFGYHCAVEYRFTLAIVGEALHVEVINKSVARRFHRTSEESVSKSGLCNRLEIRTRQAEYRRATRQR